MIFKDGLPHLTREEWSILAYVGRSPRRVSIKDISRDVGIDVNEAIGGVIRLKEIGMLRRDTAPSNHPDATFYINPEIRRIVDSILNHIFSQYNGSIGLSV